MAAIACFSLVLTFAVQHEAQQADFVAFYAAGRIVNQYSGHRLSDFDLQKKVESSFFKSSGTLPFYHPPYEALLFSPLARLSFPAAYLCWTAFNLAILLLFVYLLRFTPYRLTTEMRLVCLAACFFPILAVLMVGQDSLLLLPILILAFIALKRGREGAAGFVLGLGVFRFELMLPFIFVFLLRRRWKLIAGFLGSSFLALVASLAVAGWSGLLDYGRLLIRLAHAEGNRAIGIDVKLMPSLRGFLASQLGGFVTGAVLFWMVVIGSLALLGWAAWQFSDFSRPDRRSFDLEYCLALLAALLASYHLNFYALSSLALVFFLGLGYETAHHCGRPSLFRPAVGLLLLFALIVLTRMIFQFPHLDVLFLVLLGLMSWLSREISSLKESETSA